MVVTWKGCVSLCLGGLDCCMNAWNRLVKECGEESRCEAFIFHERAGRYLVRARPITIRDPEHVLDAMTPTRSSYYFILLLIADFFH